MKINYALLASTALVVFCANGAFASDMPKKAHKKVPTPVVEPVVPAPVVAAPVVAAAPKPTVVPYSWTGYHLGLGGGAQFLSAKASNNHTYSNNSNNGYYAQDIGNSDLGKFSGFGRIEAGADYQMDKVVVGTFVDFNLGGGKAESSHSSAIWNSNNNFHSTTSVEVGNSWDIGGRLGYLVNDKNLVYALAGYSAADVTISTSYLLDGTDWTDPSLSSSSNGWKSGYVVGAGWETTLTNNLTLKAEYRYADYGTVSTSATAVTPPNVSGSVAASSDVSVQSVSLVLSYKF
jgi:outer membrane immunogenic protein